MSSETNSGSKYNGALALLTSLFFIWGFITVLNDILIPHFRNIFDLNYAQSTLIQFLFFFAYFVMSIPSSRVLQKFGYKRGMVIGLLVTGLGTLLFYPAAVAVSYPFFLFAFFVLASGITLLQVSANPFVAVLGKSETAASRLNLTQGVNSLGTTLAPIFGSLLILGTLTFFPFYDIETGNLLELKQEDSIEASSFYTDAIGSNTISATNENPTTVKDRNGFYWYLGGDSAYRYDGRKYWETFPRPEFTYSPNSTRGILLVENKDEPVKLQFLDATAVTEFRQHEAKTVQMPYLGIGVFLFLLAGVFALIKLPNIEYQKAEKTVGNIFRHRHLVSGTIAIFVYVGAEVAIGTFLILFWELEEIANLPEKQGGFYVSLYWGSAMIGRFSGALIQRYVKPNRVLAVAACCSIILVTLTILGSGTFAMWTIILVGLFNSIMFPTIFTLSIDGLGKETAKGSGLLIMAIVGGAVIPLLMGFLADAIGVQSAFVLTLFCYAYILFFAVRGYKLKQKNG
jgi:FHS family L-fucose permease-like MFS transporter